MSEPCRPSDPSMPNVTSDNHDRQSANLSVTLKSSSSSETSDDDDDEATITDDEHETRIINAMRLMELNLGNPTGNSRRFLTSVDRLSDCLINLRSDMMRSF
jgi:hypothetical protein